MLAVWDMPKKKQSLNVKLEGPADAVAISPDGAHIAVGFINGKFSASSGACCVFFNTGKEHPASALHPDGTCKFNHVCDHWVSNKGKNGKCLGTAGTKGHCRATCDNPHKCDAPVA